MSIIIVGVGQAEFDGESSIPFPAVLSYRTPMASRPHPLELMPGHACCLGGLVCPERVCQYPCRSWHHPDTGLLIPDKEQGLSCMLVSASTCF